MTEPPKKLLILFILELLRRETDTRHRLSQQQLIARLEQDYHMKAERKAVARNIDDLRQAGYDIVYDNGYYLADRDFEDSELRLLIDSVLFSRHLSASQSQALIAKLSGLASRYFDPRARHIRVLPGSDCGNRQLFYTIDVLDEAISQQRQVAFYYTEYRTDNRPHPRRPEKYVVSPYGMAARNGRYYLLCNTRGHDNVAHYRLDRIAEIELLPQAARPLSNIAGMEHGLDLPRHMAEHIYMYSGASCRVRFRADLAIVDQIYDWFGGDVSYEQETDTTVTASVTVNETAMFYWLLQYGAHVQVLEPLSLVERVRSTVSTMAEHYGLPR